MEVLLLNGETVRIRLSNKWFKVDGKSKSLFQHRIGVQLSEKYLHDRIFEEVQIPGERFILDFFIPSVGLVVETHGKQHVEHVRYFHRTKQDFHKQQDTDQRKREWCNLNSFRLLEIYDE